MTADRSTLGRGRLAVSGALAIAVALTCGCKKNKESKKDEPATVAGFAAVPATATAVVGIDVERLANASLAKRAVGQLFLRDKALKVWADRVAAECQIVPGKTVTRALLALGAAETDSLLVATGTFSEAQLAACVGKSLAEDGGRLVTQASGPHTLYRTESGKKKSVVWFAISGARTLLVSSSGPFLEAALGTGPKIMSDPAMKAVIDRADQKAMLWAAGRVPEAVGGGLAKVSGGAASAPKTMTIRADLDGGLSAQLSAELASADEAKALVTQGDAQIGLIALAVQKHGLGQLVQKVKFSSNDRYIEVRVEVTEDELATLLARIDSRPTTMQNPPAVGADAGPKPDQGATSPKGE